MINLGANVFIKSKLKFIYENGNHAEAGEPLFKLAYQNNNIDIVNILMKHKLRLNQHGQND